MASYPGATLEASELLALRGLAAGLRLPAARQGGGGPGPIAARKRGQGLDVDDVRPWAAGDDLRHLDRNLTARSGTPHVRRFRDERERTVILMADFRPSMLWGSRGSFRSVAAARALALAGWRWAALGCRIGVFVAGAAPEAAVRPLAGAAAMPAAVARLALAHEQAWAAPAGDDPPLDAAIEAATRLLPRDGALLIASAFETPGARLMDALLGARDRAELYAVLVADAFERRPRPGAYPFATTAAGRARWGRARPEGGSLDQRRALLARAGVVPLVVDAGTGAAGALAALADLHVARF